MAPTISKMEDMCELNIRERSTESPLEENVFNATGAAANGAETTQAPQRENVTSPNVPSISKINEALENFNLNSLMFDDNYGKKNSNYEYYFGADNVDSSRKPRSQFEQSNEDIDDNNFSFNFFMKTLMYANNYVSALTSEESSILQIFPPTLFHTFLVEVLKKQNEKRPRKATHSECAFCKNNGEAEEWYSGHCLKDERGRVQCPVLSAFRCPRCGATGDHAHTIKYCPEADASDRMGNFGSRRRLPPSSLLLQNYEKSMQPSSVGSLQSFYQAGNGATSTFENAPDLSKSTPNSPQNSSRGQQDLYNSLPSSPVNEYASLWSSLGMK